LDYTAKFDEACGFEDVYHIFNKGCSEDSGFKVVLDYDQCQRDIGETYIP